MDNDKGYAPMLAELFAVHLSVEAPRLQVTTKDDIRVILEAEAQRMLLGGTDEGDMVAVMAGLAGALDAEYSFFLRMYEEPFPILFLSVFRMDEGRVIARYSQKLSEEPLPELDALFSQVASKMATAGMCGNVEPAEKHLNPGEENDLTYRLTDLGGEDFDGADVTISVSVPTCGRLEPDLGSTSDGEFVTTFTANDDHKPCTGQLEFKAQSENWAGKLETRPHEGRITISVSETWDVEMRMDMGDESDKVEITWQGSFFTRPDGTLGGGGTGSINGDFPNYPCLVLDFDKGEMREEPNPTTLQGPFTFDMHGNVSGEGDYAQFNLTPVGLGGPLVYRFGNDSCAPGLTYDLFTGPIFSMAAQQPNTMAGTSQFILRAQDGASQTFPLSLIGSGSVDVTIHKSDGNGQ